MDYKISDKNLNKLIQYLSQKPYSEVFQAIEMLSTLDKIEEPEKENGPVN
tara:strand:- start:134 stop:283 length:150 start_codon:yes stop_codon:yes gene_type:complete